MRSRCEKFRGSFAGPKAETSQEVRLDFSGMFFQGWSGIARTLIVGALAYVALVAFLRISGKRTLAKLNAFDLVVTVALGSTLATILLSRDVALAEGLSAFALLIALQYLVTYTSVRFTGFAKAVRSEPSLLVHEGEICTRTMTKQRITEAEVESAIRASGGESIQAAVSVVLEADGTISVRLRESH
jgi:uncharacterized membrane protein YcaP (DUF421 family)